MESFETRIEDLRNVISNVNSGIGTGESFEFTNVKPLTEDLENLVETMEMLERYKKLFEKDVDTLVQVGKSLQEQDEILSQPIHDSRGYTPLSI